MTTMASAKTTICAVIWVQMLDTTVPAPAISVVPRSVPSKLPEPPTRMERKAGIRNPTPICGSTLMSVDPQMGVGFLIPAFLSILVGGSGSLLGTLLGTTLIAGAGTVVSSIWTQITAQIVVFALAIVVIRLFPQGLTGGRG